MKQAVRDFKEFVVKGDVVALAVAVIIATAFGAVIAAFVANIITPLSAVFLLVVRPYNAFRARFAREGDDDVPPPEYAVATAGAGDLPGRLNDRGADGWRVVSVGEAGDGALAAVLVKGED
jgi:hypothetical protein